MKETTAMRVRGFLIGIHEVELLSEKPLVSTKPPVARPRIFGDDVEWMTEQQLFENMDCLSMPKGVRLGKSSQYSKQLG